MEPYSEEPRRVIVQPLDAEYSLAFNYADPSGVKLVSRRAADRLRAMQAGESSGADDARLDADLRAAGLAGAPRLQRATLRKQFATWVHVVNDCNLSCWYCYIPQLRKAANVRNLPAQAMTEADAVVAARETVRYCAEAGVEQLHVKFAGGEPTLNMSAVAIYCRAVQAAATQLERDLGLRFSIITNGTFDVDAVLPVLERYQFAVSISIDGYGEAHDRIRFEVEKRGGIRRKGTWDSIWNSVARLRDANIRPYFLYTVTPSNLASVARFSEHVHSLGLGYRLSLVRGRGEIPIEARQEMARSLRAHYASLGANLDVVLAIGRHAKFAEWNLRKAKTIACSAGRSYVAVGHEGSVSTCQMNLDETFGNIKADGLDAPLARMLSNEATSRMADPSMRAGACVRCQYFRVCAGGCPQHARDVVGTTDAPSPWCDVYGAVIPAYVEAIGRQMLRRLRQRRHTLRSEESLA